jgi:S-formylglutathione hydrolase FrmB
MPSQLAQLLGLQGDVHLDIVDSAALSGNALGDPARRTLLTYTPVGYDAEGSRRYPVLYFLHGFTGDAAGAVSARPWERNVIQRADALIAAGRMPPAIVAVVDGFTRLGGSQYVNSVHNGNYGDYVAREIVSHVDRSYRTIAHEGGRAVFGKSSGGFGSIHLALEYPGTFAAFASHSGDMYFNGVYPQTFADVQRTLERFDFDLAKFVAAFEGKPKRPQPEYVTMEILGYASAYSPRAREPFAIDLPLDRSTGELREDVWARWLAFDPVERVAEKAEQLGRLRLRYLDCGRRDEYGLDVGARVLAQRLRGAGLEVRHEEFDDTHGNVTYRYEVSLPALCEVLDRE